MKSLKYTFFLLISLLFAVQAIAQPDTRRMNISIGVFSPSATSYDYEGAIGVVGSTGYDVDDIVAGEDMFWDDRSRYRVDSVEIIVAGTSATVWVTDLYTAGAPQSGKGTLGKPSPKTGVQPLTENGSNFITEAQEAKIMTDNLNRLDSLGGDGNGLISALPAGTVNIDGGTNSLIIDAGGGMFLKTDGTYRVSGDNDDDFQIYFRGPHAVPSIGRKFKVGDVEFENKGTRIEVDDEKGIIILDAAEFGVEVNNEGSNKYVSIGDYSDEQDQTEFKVDDAAGEISMRYSAGTYVLPNTMPTANQVLGEGATDDNVLEWVDPPAADGNLGTQDVAIPGGAIRKINFANEDTRLEMYEQGANKTAFRFKSDVAGDDDEKTYMRVAGASNVEMLIGTYSVNPMIQGVNGSSFQIGSEADLHIMSGIFDGFSYSVPDDPGFPESSFSLILGNGGASASKFYDFTTVKSGLEYGEDYSAGFVDRSLVDKGYVDTQVASAGDGNGIIDALPAGGVTVAAAGNALQVTGTSLTRFTAAGAAEGELVVSGASAIPSSLSHIEGVDSTKVNISATGGINLKSTRYLTVDADSVFMDKLNILRYGTGSLGMINTSGSWNIEQGPTGTLNVYGYNSTPGDPIGMFINGATGSLQIGDRDADIHGTRMTLDNAGFLAQANYKQFIKSNGDVTWVGDAEDANWGVITAATGTSIGRFNASAVVIDNDDADDIEGVVVGDAGEDLVLSMQYDFDTELNRINLGKANGSWGVQVSEDYNNEELELIIGDAVGTNGSTKIVVSEPDVNITLNANLGTKITGAAYTYTLPVTTPTAADSLYRVMAWKEGGTGTFQVFNGANYRTAIATGNILPYDDYVEVDPNVTVHLPAPAAGLAGKVFHIIAGGGTGGANPGTIDVVDGSSTIETGASLTLDTAFESYSLVCNGSQWIVLNNKP